jgi:hypothetical protein
MKPVEAYKSSLGFLLKVLFGGGCRFTPTCSDYASEAVSEYGILKGTALGLRRLAHCRPLGGSGFDPVPPIA